MTTKSLQREDIENVVLPAVQNALRMEGQSIDLDSPKSALIGENAIIDSVSLVTLIVDLEDIVSERFQKSIILVDEKDILGDDSPFRNVDALVDYISELVNR
jgi:acyl carrier protein